jgi:hypothetical protein
MKKETKAKFIEAKMKFYKILYPTFTPADLDNFRYYTRNCNSTNGLTQGIIEYLKWNGCQAERINTTGRKISTKEIVTNVVGLSREIGSEKWIKGTGTKGSSDIHAMIPILINGKKLAQSLKIEVKFAKDSQSNFQHKYERLVNEMGGIYYIAKNIDDTVEWIDQLLIDYLIESWS